MLAIIFDNDIILQGESTREVEKLPNRWNIKMKERGLKLSIEKIEVIVMGKNADLGHGIFLNG